MADKTATYSIKTDSNAKEVGDQGAAALERLRASIMGSQSNIRSMGDALKSLRGVTDEVKGAKEKLKAAIEAERSSISASTVAILKQGTTYAKLTEETKKAAAESAKLRGDSLKAAGGPVEELSGKFEKLKTALSTSSGRLALFAVAAVAAVAAVYKLGSALAGATASLVEWIFQSSLLNRQQALQREAWTGSAQDALHLGHQLDALANKVATPRAELEKLAGATVKALNNSRVSGQGIVDTFNAVAEASAAMGEEVGSKLAGMIEAAKNTGRVFVTWRDFMGTGLKIQDVGAQLAKSMHVGVAEAVAALQSGRVGVNDFAAALRAASEIRFGQVNALQRLGAIVENFQKRLQALTKDIHLDGILNGIEELSKLLDQSTVSGSVLKTMIEGVAEGLGPAFKGAIPFIKEVFERIELGALRIEIAMYRARNAVRAAFADRKDAIAMADVLAVVDRYVDGIAEGGQKIGRSLVYGLIVAAKAFYLVKDAAVAVRDFLKGGWDTVGTNIVDGITGGLASRLGGLKAMGLKLADTLKDAFKGALGIQSPSKVFERYGQQTGEGYEQGVEKSGSGVQAAVQKMAPGAPAAAGTNGGRGGGSSPTVNINLHAGNKAAAEEMSRPSFLAGLTRAVEEALVSAGVAPQSEPA